MTTASPTDRRRAAEMLQAWQRYQPSKGTQFDEIRRRLEADDASAIQDLMMSGTIALRPSELEVFGKCISMAMRLAADGIEPTGPVLHFALRTADALDREANQSMIQASFAKYGPDAAIPAAVGEFLVNRAIVQQLASNPAVPRDPDAGISEMSDALTMTEYSELSRRSLIRMNFSFRLAERMLQTFRAADHNLYLGELTARRVVAEQFARGLKSYCTSGEHEASSEAESEGSRLLGALDEVE